MKCYLVYRYVHNLVFFHLVFPPWLAQPVDVSDGVLLSTIVDKLKVGTEGR